MRRRLGTLVLTLVTATLTIPALPQAAAADTVTPTVTLDIGAPTAYAHEPRTVTAAISYNACQSMTLERFEQGAWREEDWNSACGEPRGVPASVEFEIAAPKKAGEVQYRVVAEESTDYDENYDEFVVASAVSETEAIDYLLDPSEITGWPTNGGTIKVGQALRPLPVRVTWADGRLVHLQRRVGTRWKTEESLWPDFDDVADLVVQLPVAERAGKQQWRLVMPGNEAGRAVTTPTMSVNVARLRTVLRVVRKPRRVETYIGGSVTAKINPGLDRRVYLQQYVAKKRRWINAKTTTAYGRTSRVRFYLPDLYRPGVLRFRVVTKADAVGTAARTKPFAVRYID